MPSIAFVRSMEALAAYIVVCFGFLPTALYAASSKKGVGEYAQPLGAKTLSESNVSWYYDWQPTTDVAGLSTDVHFVPMIWGTKNLNAADLQATKASGAETLLGFNEPNEKTQSSMTVQQALDAWPQLKALNMQLGSPATGTGDDVRSDGWLARFMAGAKARGYRVDFVCIHPYQTSFDPALKTYTATIPTHGVVMLLITALR